MTVPHRLRPAQRIGPSGRVHQTFQRITSRFAGYQAQWLNVHVDFPLLQRIALPITGPVRYPGNQNPRCRVIRLFEVPPATAALTSAVGPPSKSTRPSSLPSISPSELTAQTNCATTCANSRGMNCRRNDGFSEFIAATFVHRSSSQFHRRTAAECIDLRPCTNSTRTPPFVRFKHGRRLRGEAKASI